MRELLLSTQSEWSALILRLTIGIIMFPHGAQKLFGMFGGYGYRATVNFFVNSMKLPFVIAFLVIVIEFIGPIALVMGFATRVWAFAIIIIMMGAIITTNYKNGFFMNWFGNQAGEGYEYHLLVIGLCIVLMIIGGGRFSIDNVIQEMNFE